ncbi:MAG: hypothetical protein ABL901_01000 [Hyphomicrobiaceae bacterium]
MSIDTKPQTPDALAHLKKKHERILLDRVKMYHDRMAMTGRGSMTAEQVLAKTEECNQLRRIVNFAIDNADWIAAEHIRRIADQAKAARAAEDRQAMLADSVTGDILDTFPGAEVRQPSGAPSA